MSHHYAGPNFGFPHGDARFNLTDLYAFPKPGESGKSILVLDVHPAVGLSPLGPTTSDPFASTGIYEFKFDTNGDVVADIAYRVRFSSIADGVQTATVYRVEGADAAGTGEGGQVIIDRAPVSMGHDARVTDADGYRFFAGWRSDPFFFDTNGAINNLQFTGEDYFAEKDVCSIVLEVPNSVLVSKRMGLWIRALDQVNGKWVQVDRTARPSQGVFLPGDEQSAYVTGEPKDDARFVAAFAHSLQHTGGYMLQDATRVARSLLPDILLYDPTRAASFPDNGRALTDDVMDVFITIITNGKQTRDNVACHTDLLSEFPYLGPPHQARSL
jgi:Domain of unknown function (DUF4331)